MNSVFLTLLAPVLVLWIGACVFYVLDHLVRPQDAGVAEALVLLLALGALLLVMGSPGTGTLPAGLAFGEALADAGWPGNTPSLRVDPPANVLAVLLLAIAALAALASLAESGLLPLRDGPVRERAADPRVTGRAGRLAALGAALLFLFAGDWATMALAWVAGDLVMVYTRQAAVFTEDTLSSKTSWTVVLSLIGAICLGLVAVVLPEEGGTSGALASGLALAAIVLRVLPFPLPAWSLPFARRHTLLARVFAYLVPTLLGVHLCAQLAPWVWQADLEGSAGSWLAVVRGSFLAVWAAVALLVSAFKAWSAREPGPLIAHTTLYGAALIVLGCALNLPSSWLWLVGVGSVLNVCALSVSWTQCPYLDVRDPRTWWRVAPVGVALLSFAGMPLTIGFGVQAITYAALLAEGRWLVLLLIVAQSGVLGALLRVLLEVECVLPELEEGHTGPHSHAWQRELAYGAGAVLALGILVLGIVPSLLGAPGPGTLTLGALFGQLEVPAWAAMLLPVVGALLLYRVQDRIAAWMENWAPLIERVLDGHWLYQGIEQVAGVVGAIIWNASLVVEGAGYMAWVTLFGLVVLVLVLANR